MKIEISFEGKPSKTEIIKELQKLIIEEITSDVAVRLEKEYTIKEVADDKKLIFVASDSFVSTPRVGEYYSVNKNRYQVTAVEHSFSSKEAGTIYVKKTNKILQILGILEM